MTAVPDVLEYIRAALASDPKTLARVEPVLSQARQTYGGDTVYIRSRDPNEPRTRRTVQRRMRMA